MAGALPDPTTSLPQNLAKVFAPVESRALGVAIGLTLGGMVLLVTIFHLIVGPRNAPNIELLAGYFYGYSVSLPGAIAGFLWSLLTGFAIGWFAGSARNLVLRGKLLMVRARAELDQPFLDKIS